MERLVPREPEILAPGAVHLPGWMDAAVRRELVDRCRDWTSASGGARRPRMRNGSMMSVGMVGLGWHWHPYRYSRTRDDGDGGPAVPFPGWLGELGRRAVVDAALVDRDVSPRPAAFAPDVALVNWYAPESRMGMHADRDEPADAPVVSLSVGQSGLFRFGNPVGRGRPWVDVVLESGDVVVFGGPSRRSYHGVPRLVPGTGDPWLDGLPGRLNVTIRETGLGG